MARATVPRLDLDGKTRNSILPYCRLASGEIWEDPIRGHKIGVIDATDAGRVRSLFAGARASLIINDPPYNISAGNRTTKSLFSGDISTYMDFSRHWLKAALSIMGKDGYLYVWLGADQSRGFQPLPDFIILMRDFEDLTPRSFITMRNQRGYGTQKNWMFVRQELLCYSIGDPPFAVAYTNIPKILKGYYKNVGGKSTENIERGRSDTIRPGNVWVDIQQVFYRMEENVPGAYAQKPLKAIDRIITTSSLPGDTIADMFSHSGTTLLSAEINDRRCITCDIDPIFAELSIRRLEQYRTTGRTGWQRKNPFPEVDLPFEESIRESDGLEAAQGVALQRELPLEPPD